MIVVGELKTLIAGLKSDVEAVKAKIDALQVIADCGEDPSKYDDRVRNMDNDSYERHMSYVRKGK